MEFNPYYYDGPPCVAYAFWGGPRTTGPSRFDVKADPNATGMCMNGHVSGVAVSRKSAEVFPHNSL